MRRVEMPESHKNGLPVAVLSPVFSVTDSVGLAAFALMGIAHPISLGISA